MMAEYQPLADACKAKALAGQKKYYYVFFTGTRPDCRGQGLCSAVMKKYQERASRDQTPILLEATTAKSMRLYSRLGWEVVDEIVLGKGKVSADGLLCKGGEGVKIWGMIWRPTAPDQQKAPS
jgi:ribosomal protein S18 acetylase RimI-like enzyme